MKLYNFGFGPYPQRVNIYLAEKGLFDVQRVMFKAPTGKTDWPPAEIAAISQTGSLPILLDEAGTTITQSLAILEFLEDRYPATDMRGSTAAARARTREIVSVFDEALDAFALWARYSNLGGHDKAAYREVIKIGSDGYIQKLQLAERMIDHTDFLAGDTVTIADCVAMALLHYTASFYDVPIPTCCPQLTRWYERFATRPSAVCHDYPATQLRIARGLMEQSSVVFPG